MDRSEAKRKEAETRKLLGPRLGHPKGTRDRVFGDLPSVRLNHRANRLPSERGW